MITLRSKGYARSFPIQVMEEFSYSGKAFYAKTKSHQASTQASIMY